MALRDTMVVLADELWAEAADASERKSHVEASTKREVANKIYTSLGYDAKDPKEEAVEG